MLIKSTKRIAMFLIFEIAAMTLCVQSQDTQTPTSANDRIRPLMKRKKEMEGEAQRPPQQKSEGIMMLDFIQKETQRYIEEQKALRDEIKTIMMEVREQSQELRKQSKETGVEPVKNNLQNEAEEKIRVVIAKMIEASAAYHANLASLLRENKEIAIDRIIGTIKERGKRHMDDRLEEREPEKGPDPESQNTRKNNSAQDSEDVF